MYNQRFAFKCLNSNMKCREFTKWLCAIFFALYPKPFFAHNCELFLRVKIFEFNKIEKEVRFRPISIYFDPNFIQLADVSKVQLSFFKFVMSNVIKKLKPGKVLLPANVPICYHIIRLSAKFRLFHKQLSRDSKLSNLFLFGFPHVQLIPIFLLNIQVSLLL